MFSVGDLIIYSSHGICQIDDICEKTYFGETKNYYTLHPLSDQKLVISTPVDNKLVMMLEIMDNKEALELIDSFSLAGIDWIEKDNQRNQKYSILVNTGNRQDISQVINTLMRRELEIEGTNKKLFVQDRKLLTNAQSILFHELALALNTTYNAIFERVSNLVAKKLNVLI